MIKEIWWATRDDFERDRFKPENRIVVSGYKCQCGAEKLKCNEVGDPLLGQECKCGLVLVGFFRGLDNK